MKKLTDLHEKETGSLVGKEMYVSLWLVFFYCLSVFSKLSNMGRHSLHECVELDTSLSSHEP